MRKIYILLCFVLSFLLLGVGQGPRVVPWPDSGEPGSNAKMFEFCRKGGKGINYNTSTEKYGATCGNYDWSLDTLGTSASSGGFVTCTSETAAITAMSDPGGTETTITSAAHGLSNGNSVRITGTVSYNGWHQISNVATDNFRIPVDFVADDATGTWVQFRTPDDACYYADEMVKRYANVDAMIAQNNTRLGGKIYLPEMDAPATIYVYDGCLTDATCPVMDNIYHYVRNWAAFGGRQFIAEGPQDFDGVETPSSQGRRGVYLVSDSQWFTQPSDAQLDAAGGRFAYRDFTAGTKLNVNECVPLGVVASDCNYAAAKTSFGNSEPPSDLIGAYSFNYGDEVAQNWSEICVYDGFDLNGAEGVCKENPNIACTRNKCSGGATICKDLSDCVGAGHGTCTVSTTRATNNGCDFGGGDDLGPCIGIGTYIKEQLETYKDVESTVTRPTQQVLLGFYTKNPSDQGDWDPLSGGYTRYAYASNADNTCGVGNDGLEIRTMLPVDINRTYAWRMDNAAIEDEEMLIHVIDPDHWYNGDDAGFLSGNFHPNDWKGSDRCNVADYESDAELECDAHPTISPTTGYGGGFDSVSMLHGSPNYGGAVDCDVGAAKSFLRNSLIAYRYGDDDGMCADLCDNLLENNLWWQNHCGKHVLNFFGGQTVVDGDLFWGNHGSQMTFREDAKGITVRDVEFISPTTNTGTPIFDFRAGQDILIEGARVVGGNSKALAIFQPEDDTGLRDITLRGIRMIGGSLLDSAIATFAVAAIIFTDSSDAGSPDYGGNLENILLEDIHVETSRDEAVLVWFDGQDTEARNIVTDRPQVKIRDVSLTQVCQTADGNACGDYAANGKLVVWYDLDSGGGGGVTDRDDCAAGAPGPPCDAGDANEIYTSRYLPEVTNARLDGVRMPDVIQTVAAAQTKDCDDLPHGTVARIHDDDGVGDCDDAGADGILDGLGTDVSTCVCDGAGTWAALE